MNRLSSWLPAHARLLALGLTVSAASAGAACATANADAPRAQPKATPPTNVEKEPPPAVKPAAPPVAQPLPYGVSCDMARREGELRIKALEQELASARAELAALKANGGQPGLRKTRGLDPTVRYAVPLTNAVYASAPAARVTIVRAYEYACFFCDKSNKTIEELTQKYGSDIRFVQVPFVVHPSSATGPALAACAAGKQGKFKAVDAALWQDVYAKRAYDPENCWLEGQRCPVLEGVAKRAKLNLATFRKDMQTTCVAELDAAKATMQRFAVNGTPTFFINGKPLTGAQPTSAFIAAIDAELAEVAAAEAQGIPPLGYYNAVVLANGVPNVP